MSYFPFSGGTYFLGSSIGSTDNTILLSSFIEPVTGIPYTMALLNSSIVYATIAPKTSSSEFISFTGITQNANGTATLTGVVRGLAKKYPFTTSSTYKQPHAGQSTFIISDAPQVFESFMTLANPETVTGIKTFATGATPLITDQPTTDLMAVNKLYADSLAIAGAPNASTSTKGIVQEATTSQVNAGTAAGSTGAILFASPADLAASIYGLQLPSSDQKAALAGTGTPSVSNKFVTADTDALKQLLSNLSTTTTLGTSDTLYPSQNAVKTYVDNNVPTSTNGTTSKNVADASTTQTIAHGLGRTPKKVRITFMRTTASSYIDIGTTVYNGTTQSTVGYSHYNNTAGSVTTMGTTTIILYTNGAGDSTNIQTGVVTVDGTNINIVWTKANSPTGVWDMMWEAQ